MNIQEYTRIYKNIQGYTYTHTLFLPYLLSGASIKKEECGGICFNSFRGSSSIVPK